MIYMTKTNGTVVLLKFFLLTKCLLNVSKLWFGLVYLSHYFYLISVVLLWLLEELILTIKIIISFVVSLMYKIFVNAARNREIIQINTCGYTSKLGSVHSYKF